MLFKSYMASTNQSPEYQKAHGRFLSASNDEERLEALDEMIRECPKHKSSENMLANLKTRRKKLLSKLSKSKKSGKSKFKGIKKEDMQAVIVGFTNSGKSSLLSLLTNAKSTISDVKFSTIRSVIGMMPFSGTHIQLIEIPAIESEYYDKGVVHTADAILLLVTNLDQIKKVDSLIHSDGKRIIVFNNKGNLSDNELRKINATLQSKKYNFIIINTQIQKDFTNLKEKVFKSFDKIRVFTKEPGKLKSPRPIILFPFSTVKEVAEKILKGFSNKVKETKIWGPSSKFPGQKVGLAHKLKDLDVVEFKTR